MRELPPSHHSPGVRRRASKIAALGLCGLSFSVVFGVGLHLVRTHQAELRQVAAPEPGPTAAAVEAPPAEPATRAAEAQRLVEELEERLGSAQAELEDLRLRAETAGEEAALAVARAAALEAEVTRLDQALARARGQRDGARAELVEALARLDAQIGQTRMAEQDRDTWKAASHDNLWAAFVEGAKVDLCEKGTKRGLERCHAAVSATLDATARLRFDDCLERQMTAPVLVRVDAPEAAPEGSVPFPGDSRPGRQGWHVQFCDAALPEALATAPEEPDPAVMVLAGH
jgi:hypothetical protein